MGFFEWIAKFFSPSEEPAVKPAPAKAKAPAAQPRNLATLSLYVDMFSTIVIKCVPHVSNVFHIVTLHM